MLIIKFIIMVMLFLGLLCTLAPRLHGTVIILATAGVYALILGIHLFPLWVAESLLLVTLVAELGANGLRFFLTRHSEVSRVYSVNTTVCNVAGIVVADAFLGALIGMTLWEVLVGKNLFPRLDSMSKVLVRLIITALVRLICGLIMIIIVVKYMMYSL